MTAEFTGRREDHRLLTGRGRYTNDQNLPGQLHAVFRRSDRAHARLRSIDKAVAERAPGVVAVITGADLPADAFHDLPPIVPFPGRGGQRVLVPHRPILARDRVRFVGEELAVVIAETRDTAIDAAEQIDVQYDDLPVVVGFDAALAPGAPDVHDNVPGNVCFDFEYGDEARARELLALSEHVVRVTLDSPRVAPTPMEPRGFLTAYDAATDSFDVYSSNQGGPALRDGLATMLGIPADRIRVQMVDVGGAFGARSFAFPEYPLLMHAAKTLRRPIKWLGTRTEDFLTDNHGRAVTLSGELGFDRSGRFRALRTEWLCDSGAYLSVAGVLTNSLNGMTIGAGVYDVQAIYGRHRQVITNTAPTNAYRGAGRPEANYIVERLADEAEERHQGRPDAVPDFYRHRVRQWRFLGPDRYGEKGLRLGWLRGPQGGRGTTWPAPGDWLCGLRRTFGRRRCAKGRGRRPLRTRGVDHRLHRGRIERARSRDGLSGDHGKGAWDRR
jgi:aerobic carbon-monoxide dehydrogenase large subunit